MPRRTRTKPVVRWLDLDKITTEGDDESNEPDDDVFEEWPDEDESRESQGVAEAVLTDRVFNLDDEVDLLSEMLRGLLSDKSREGRSGRMDSNENKEPEAVQEDDEDKDDANWAW